jgi:hypothetical protein
MTRVLAVMGSGETAPTHTKTHRQLIDRVTGPAVMLDTPYGFQANADDISQRAVEYFDRSVQRPITVSSWRRGDDAALVRETALTRLRGAGYVFAGPGSPTYALRQWAGSALPALLAEKLQPGADGVVTFASAAALTLGRVTVPVYEIYKVGEEPRWFDGLDLVGAVTGWSVAVIPHFDNAEGGGHDTRFCYLGEPRLQVMEAQLPDGAWVLGVDEPPSSSGLGHHPLKVAARVRIPLGVLVPQHTRHHTASAPQQGTARPRSRGEVGVHAGLSSRRSRVRVPSGPLGQPRKRLARCCPAWCRSTVG